MATGTTFAAVTEKRLFGTADFRDRLLGHLRTLVQESYEKSYRGGCVYDAALNLISGGNDKITISGTSLATDGQGHLLDVAPSGFATGLQFQNTAAVEYEIGLHYAEVPSGIQINPRTGLPEFVGWDETIGESGTPDLVTDNGNGTITFRVNTITESGVSNAGRKVRVYKNIPGPNATTEVVAIEELTVAWTGSNNEITTAAVFGQETVSTTAADYTVVLMGATIKRNTTLYDVDGYAFLGKVTGGGSGAPPSGFDVTDQDVIDMSLSDMADITSRNATTDRLKIDVKSYTGDVGDPQIQVRDPSGTPVFTVDGNGNVVIEGTTTQQDFVQVNSSETITDNLTAGDDGATDSHKIKGTWWHTNNAETANYFHIDGATGHIGLNKPADSGFWLDVANSARFQGLVQFASAVPNIQFLETDVAIDDGGLWRLILTNGDIYFQMNTAAGGDFTSATSWLRFNRALSTIYSYFNFSPISDDTRDIGSAGLEWKDLYIDGTAYVDTLSLSTVAGEGVATSIIPTTNGTLNLGSVAYRWNQIITEQLDSYLDTDTATTPAIWAKHDATSVTNTRLSLARLQADTDAAVANDFGGSVELDIKDTTVAKVQWWRRGADDQCDLYFFLRDAVDANTAQLKLKYDGGMDARTILPFATDTYDLGSPSYRWANIYTANLNVGEDINPAADLTYDLGQPSVRWLNVYTQNVAGGPGTGTDFVNISGPDYVNINGPLYLGGFDYAEPSGTMAGGGHTFLAQEATGALVLATENGDGRVNLTWNAYFDGTTWRGWKGSGEGATRLQITENVGLLEWTWWVDDSVSTPGEIANVRSIDQKRFVIGSAGVWAYDKVIIESTEPRSHYVDSDLAVDAGGLWRIRIVGGDYSLEENTAAAGNFTTISGWFRTDRANAAIEFYKNVWPSADDSFDLGTAAQQWRHLYIDGTANIDTLSLDTTDGLGVASHLKPTTTATYDLGGANRYWRDLYLSGGITSQGILYLLSDIALEETIVIQNTGVSQGGSFIKFWSNEVDLNNATDPEDVLGGLRFYGDAGDGVNSYLGASMRAAAKTGWNVSNAESKLVWALAGSGETTATDRLALNSVQLYPITDDALNLGSATNEWGDLHIDGTAYIDTLSLDTTDGLGVATTIKPTTDGSFDLGSSTREWRNLYVDGIAYVDALVLSSAAAEGVASHIVPTADDSYDLGSSSYKWRSLYLDGTAYVDTLSLSTTAGEGVATDLIPTSNGVAALGSSSYRWSNIHAIEGTFYRSTDTLSTGLLSVTHYVPSGGASRAKLAEFVATAGASNINGFGGFVSFYNGANEVGRIEWSRNGANDQADMVWRLNSVGDNMVNQLTLHYNNGIETYHHYPYAADTWDLGTTGQEWRDVYAMQLKLIQISPRIEWRDESLAIDAGGLWRNILAGGVYRIEENTAVAGDFSTNKYWFVINKTNAWVETGADFIPRANSAYNLGNATHWWLDAYIDRNLYIDDGEFYLQLNGGNPYINFATTGGVDAFWYSRGNNRFYWRIAGDDSIFALDATNAKFKVDVVPSSQRGADLGTTGSNWDWTYTRNVTSDDYLFLSSTDDHVYLVNWEAVPVGSLAGSNVTMVTGNGNWTTQLQAGAGRVNLSWNSYYDGTTWRYWDAGGDGATRMNISTSGATTYWEWWFNDTAPAAAGDTLTWISGASLRIDSGGITTKNIEAVAGNTYDIGASGAYFENLYANTHYIDATFLAFINGSTPRLTWDSTDWIQYNRTDNKWQFGVGDSTKFEIASSYINVGFSNTTPPALFNVGYYGTPGTTDLRGSHIHSYLNSNLSSVAGTRRRLVSIGGAVSNEEYLTISQYRVSTGSQWDTSAIILSREVDNSADIGGYIQFGSADFDVKGHWRPSADSTYELGGSNYRWSTIYSGNITSQRDATGAANAAAFFTHNGLTTVDVELLIARFNAETDGTQADGFGGYVRYESEGLSKGELRWVRDGGNNQYDFYWLTHNNTSLTERLRFHWDGAISLLADANFNFKFSTDDPTITFDSGTDELRYDRSANSWYFTVGGSNTLIVSGSALTTLGPIYTSGAGHDIGSSGQYFSTLYVNTINLGAGDDGNGFRTHCKPYLDEQFDLGSTLYQWRNLYVNQTAYIDVLSLSTVAGQGVDSYLNPTNTLKDQGNSTYFWDYTYTDRLYTREGNNYTFDNYDDLALIDEYNPSGVVVEVDKAGEVRILQRASRGTLPWPMLGPRDPMAQSWFIDINDSLYFLLGAIKQLHNKHKAEVAELRAKIEDLVSLKSRVELLARKMEALTA